MQRKLVVLSIAFLILIFSTTAFAAQKPAAGKLERGVKNFVWGWTEIPKNVVETSKTSGPLVGITAGAIKGIFQAFARTASGAVDVVTFPIGPYDSPAIKPSMLSEDTK